MNNQTTEEMELETVELTKAYELGEALYRLEKNKDFQLVISEGYMKEKALDSVSLLAVDQIKKQGVRPDIMEDLVAISNLGEYFRMLKNFHAGAVQDLEAAEGPDDESELVEYDVANRGGI